MISKRPEMRKILIALLDYGTRKVGESSHGWMLLADFCSSEYAWDDSRYRSRPKARDSNQAKKVVQGQGL